MSGSDLLVCGILFFYGAAMCYVGWFISRSTRLAKKEAQEIPSGKGCDSCAFLMFENDGPVDLSQCTQYGAWDEGLMNRCSECLADYPHGASIIITPKAK